MVYLYYVLILESNERDLFLYIEVLVKSEVQVTKDIIKSSLIWKYNKESERRNSKCLNIYIFAWCIFFNKFDNSFCNCYISFKFLFDDISELFQVNNSGFELLVK